MHALIVFVLRLHLLAATKSAPPEKTLSTGTLVALLIIKTNLLVNVNVILMLNFINSYIYKHLPVIAR